ncbi:MAG: phosphoribosylformylglycinamidine cyclo-ligase, partial [Calditrichaeota bacterium]
VGEALLAEHRSYYPAIQLLKNRIEIHGIAHITGGGLLGNTRRILPDSLDIVIDWQAWEWPPIFRLLQQLGEIETEEMRRVFNLGIGMVIIVSNAGSHQIMAALRESGQTATRIGEISRA